jgi:hypothetical protein
MTIKSEKEKKKEEKGDHNHEWRRCKREEVSKSPMKSWQKRNRDKINNGEDEKEKDDQNHQYRKRNREITLKSQIEKIIKEITS